MSEYIGREEFLKRIKPFDTSDKTDKALYNFALNQMMGTPNADVVEKKKIDNAFEEMQRYSDGFHYMGKRDLENVVENCIKILKWNIGD